MVNSFVVHVGKKLPWKKVTITCISSGEKHKKAKKAVEKTQAGEQTINFFFSYKDLTLLLDTWVCPKVKQLCSSASFFSEVSLSRTISVSASVSDTGGKAETMNMWQSQAVLQGHSQDFREGGTDVCTHKFWPCPLTKWKGRSSNYHREHILNVASELESRFSAEFWDTFLVIF